MKPPAQPRDGEPFTRLFLQNQKRLAGLIFSLGPQGANYGGQFHFGLWHDEGSLEVHVHDAPGAEVGVHDSAPLPLGEWQFVAFTLDDSTLRLYRNGREIAAASCVDPTPAGPAALALGVKLDARGTRPERNTPGFWDGTLAELAVFHRPLGAA